MLKFLFIFLISLNVYAQDYNVTYKSGTYEGTSSHGYKMPCDRARTNDNMYIQSSHWQRIAETANQVKSICESKSGRLCGAITIGDKMVMGTSGVNVCAAYATARPF